ncbi:MAG TPA: POTRA domain-containing protein [Bryobacterales bacterium]|nr:POTRA domain-containing protein [Bryobacterales bacterium]
MPRAFLLCLIATALLAAQNQPQRGSSRRKSTTGSSSTEASTAPGRWPLAAIHVSGNRIFPTEKIVQAAGLRLGSLVNASDFEAALRRLTGTGAFETVAFHYEPVDKQLAVTFEVREVVDLYPVAFEGLGAPDEELRKAIEEKVPLFGPQVPATGIMVQHILQAIQDYLAAKHQSAELTSGLLPGAGGKLAMTFRSAAPAPKIVYVRFENTTVIPAETLQKAFVPNSVGVPYTEKRLAELLDVNIQPMFEEKGRLEARFGPFRTEKSTEPEGVIVTVPVQEGDEFHIDHIKLEGNERLSTAELRPVLKLASGDLANFTLIHKAAGDLERRYQHEGYIQARAAVERTLDGKKKTVDLTFRISEGEVYTMRNLTIRGLDINAEAAVKRMWSLKKGQPFNGEYPEFFLQRIEEEGLFDNLGGTSHRESVDEQAKTVDVVLEFKGGAGAPQRGRRRP